MRPRHFFLFVPYNLLSTNSRTKSEPKFCVIRAFSMEMSISTFFLIHHHHGFYYNATPEATPKRPMARPPTPKSPATAADPRSTISPARRHDPPRWGRAGPTGTCTPMGAPPEGETRGGTERPRRPWGASVVISPAGPGSKGGNPSGGPRGRAQAGGRDWRTGPRNSAQDASNRI